MSRSKNNNLENYCTDFGVSIAGGLLSTVADYSDAIYDVQGRTTVDSKVQ